MSYDEIERCINALTNYDLVVNQFNIGFTDGLECPHIEIDHNSYPGVEAHLFTIADAASWQPGLTSSANVILTGPRDESIRYDSWTKFLSIAQDILESLEQYRQGLRHGIIPSSHWIYHEIKWYRKNWDGPPHELKPAESFLHLVDESIRYHIKELNDLGFLTTQSCSGLAKDHTDRDAYLPYVMFDERTYPRSSAHLFTIADITGWIPSYGPHQFDIEFRLADAEGAKKFWDSLVACAKKMTTLLHDYRSHHTRFPHSLKGTM
jgi:hypothetical protein